MNIITNHVKGVQAGFKYPINQEVTKNADGSGGTIYKQTKKKRSSWNKWGHAFLDAAGMIPGVGNVADVVNAAWYGAEAAAGKFDDSALLAGASLAAAVPGAGLAAGGVKLAKRANDARKAANAFEAGKTIRTGIKEAGETITKRARGITGPGYVKNKYAKGAVGIGEGLAGGGLSVEARNAGYQNLADETGKTQVDHIYTTPVFNTGVGPVDAVGNFLTTEDTPTIYKPRSNKKQRYVGGVASSERQSLKSFNKFTNKVVYHGFNDRKDPVRKSKGNEF